MKNLKELFNNISYCAIFTTGRTGSDFLQGCLDGVSGILTFSGKVPFYRFCDDIKFHQIKKNYIEILNLFIKKKNNLFFRDEIENKNIDLDTKIFKGNFLNIVEDLVLTRQEFLLAVYLAYHQTLGRDINKIKIMVHHSHHIQETRRFLKDFRNSKLLVTIRDPRANLKSGIQNWIRYDNKRENQNHFYLYIRRIREDLKFAKSLPNEKFYVKLEEANDIHTKKTLSQFLGVEFDERIMKATFSGKPWIGDKLSQFSSKSGEYNNSVTNNNWENYFSDRDKLILNFFYKEYISFGYNFESTSFLKKIIVFLFIPLPFVFDKFFFSFKFYKNNKSIKKIFINLYFYIKRIFYLYKLYFKLI